MLLPGPKVRNSVATSIAGSVRHRIWVLTRLRYRGMVPVGHIWLVQTKEQHPIRFPDKDGLVCNAANDPWKWRNVHPCPKPLAEMAFMIDALTLPGQIALDCFCGTGTGLIAAEQLGRRWIGCDKSRKYCQVAMRELAKISRRQR